MLNKELIEFIKERRTAGLGDDQIRDLLKAQGGWSDFDINEAIKLIEMEVTNAKHAVPVNPEGVVTSPIEKPVLLAQTFKLHQVQQSKMSNRVLYNLNHS